MKSAFTLLFLFLIFTAQAQTFEIYVSDAGNFNTGPWQILKFDENGENATVFIDENLSWPQDILFLDEAEEVLISNLSSGCINRHHAVSGEYIGSFACGILGPTRIKIGPDSLLYVLQWNGNGRVLRYELDGTSLGEFTSVGVSQSIGLDWDTAGNLYVSSYTGDDVRKYDTAGNDLGDFITSNLSGPTNIWFDGNGDLLVADYDGTAVKRFDANGNYQGDFITGLGNCEGVDFFPNGDILIGNGATNSVKLFDSNGNYIEDLVANGAGNLLNPNAVVIREIETLGIDEGNVINKPILHPNWGTTFYISNAFKTKIELVEIWDLAGHLIQTVDPKVAHQIDADGLANGIYLGIIKLNTGETKVEKLVVSK